MSKKNLANEFSCRYVITSKEIARLFNKPHSRVMFQIRGLGETCLIRWEYVRGGGFYTLDVYGFALFLTTINRKEHNEKIKEILFEFKKSGQQIPLKAKGGGK